MKTIAIKGLIINLFITGLSLIILAPNTAIAQDKPERNVKTVRVEKTIRGNQHKMVSRLTEDQKTKIKDLRLDHMKAIQLLKAQSEELAAHLKTLNLAEKPDNKAIFKTIDEMMTTRGEIMKRMFSFKQALKAILTPEQIKEMEARHFNNRLGMGNMHQRWGQQGGRNFGRGDMMQQNRMHSEQMEQQQMMQQQQMMMHHQQMMNQQGQEFGDGQMSPQMQMKRRFQMTHKDQPNTPDTTNVK